MTFDVNLHSAARRRADFFGDVQERIALSGERVDEGWLCADGTFESLESVTTSAEGFSTFSDTYRCSDRTGELHIRVTWSEEPGDASPVTLDGSWIVESGTGDFAGYEGQGDSQTTISQFGFQITMTGDLSSG